MKILERLAFLKIWLGNGMAYANDLKYPIALAITLKLYLPTISLKGSIILVIMMLCLMIFIGWFDMKYIRLAQKVAEISTEKYNPYFTQLKKELKKSKH